ncbi:site-2 protease family protein [Patescibacteria group bacterium]
MLNILFSSPIAFIVLAVSLVIAITVHEFAHAFVADKLGDPTPKINDRLTLNPLSHLDPIGTLALLIASFGWGKPVPIDPYNLRNPKRDSALISLAGPASNLILATLLSLLLKFTTLALPASVIMAIIVLNVNLAVFNLLPIPPLDGSKILVGFLPHDIAWKIEESLSRYGMILLIFLVFPFFGQSLAITIISPIINLILSLLI